MKSINKTSSSLRKFLTVLVILTLVVGAYAITSYFTKLWPFNAPTPQQSSQESPSAAQQAAENQTKQDLIEDTNTKDSESTDNATDNQANIIITTNQEQNGTLTVLTKLYGYSDGTCTLKVTNGSHTSSQTADIIFQPEYSSCAGFSVNIAQHGTGTWNVELTTITKGQSATKKLSVEVK